MWIAGRIVAVLLAGLILSHQAWARDNDAEPPECTAANSQVATIAELWSDGRELSGECVALSGYRVGDVIFIAQRAFYGYAARRTKTPKGIVGIPYPGMQGADEGPMRGTYYGRVRLCSDDRAAYRRSQAAVRKAAERGEIMLTHLYGFCATSAGPALRVDNADEVPASDLVRMTGDDLRRSLGELGDLPPNFPYQATLGWLAQVATDGGCAKDFKPGLAPPGPPQGVGAPLWRPADDPRRSAALTRWCATGARQTVTYLVGKSSPSAFEGGVALDMVHCLCTTEDCRGLWPVALFDTGWDRDRPYFCQRVKLRPRTSSYAEGEEPEYSDYSYEFSDGYIAVDAVGFPEGTKAASGP